MVSSDATPSASNPESLGPFALLLNAATARASTSTVGCDEPQPSACKSNETVASQEAPHCQQCPHEVVESRSPRVQRLPPISQLAEKIRPAQQPQERSHYAERTVYPALIHPHHGTQQNAPPRLYASSPSDISPLAILSAAAERRDLATSSRPAYTHPVSIYPPVYPSNHANQSPTYLPVHSSAPLSYSAQHYGMLPPPIPVPYNAEVQSSSRDGRQFVHTSHLDAERNAGGAVKYVYEHASPLLRDEQPTSSARAGVNGGTFNRQLPSPAQLFSEIHSRSTRQVVTHPRMNGYPTESSIPESSTERRSPLAVSESHKTEYIPNGVKGENHVRDAVFANDSGSRTLEAARTSGGSLKDSKEKKEEVKSEKAIDADGEKEVRAGELNESSAEDEEETNCPCGSIANEGFMIACDECDTWQHGKCMGFRRREDAPKRYSCHLCHPGAVRKGSRAHSFVLKRREIHDQYFKSVEIGDLRRRLVLSLIERESKRWRKNGKWKSHVLRTFAGLLRSQYKNEKEAVISGLVLLLRMNASDVEARLMAANKKLRKSDSKSHKRGAHMSEPGSRSAVGLMMNGYRDSQESKHSHRSAVDDDDDVREDEFDHVKESPAKPVKKARESKQTRNPKQPAGQEGHLSREERKIQQIMKQFERLEQQKTKRKNATGTPKSDRMGTSPARRLSAQQKNSKKEKTTANSDQKEEKIIPKSVSESESLKDLKAGGTENDDIVDELHAGEDSNLSINVDDVPLLELKSTESNGLQAPSTPQKNTQASSAQEKRKHRKKLFVQELASLNNLNGRRKVDKVALRTRARSILEQSNYGSEKENTPCEMEVDKSAGILQSLRSGAEGYEQSEHEFVLRKRPRFSLPVPPSPGPSVLGSSVIPEVLRSPLADSGRAKKRPRVMNRKARLLQCNGSSYVVKKKVLASALTKRKVSGKDAISPSCLPSCILSDAKDKFGVEMMMINVDRDLSAECESVSSKSNRDSASSSWLSLSCSSPSPLELNRSEKSKDYNSSRASTPMGKVSDCESTDLEKTKICLKKRPRLRLDISQMNEATPPPAHNGASQSKPATTSSPISPRNPVLQGLRSVPARSPERPQLRSVPNCRIPLVSTPRPRPSMLQSSPQALSGDIASCGQPRNTAVSENSIQSKRLGLKKRLLAAACESPLAPRKAEEEDSGREASPAHEMECTTPEPSENASSNRQGARENIKAREVDAERNEKAPEKVAAANEVEEVIEDKESNTVEDDPHLSPEHSQSENDIKNALCTPEKVDRHIVPCESLKDMSNKVSESKSPVDIVQLRLEGYYQQHKTDEKPDQELPKSGEQDPSRPRATGNVSPPAAVAQTQTPIPKSNASPMNEHGKPSTSPRHLGPSMNHHGGRPHHWGNRYGPQHRRGFGGGPRYGRGGLWNRSGGPRHGVGKYGRGGSGPRNFRGYSRGGYAGSGHGGRYSNYNRWRPQQNGNFSSAARSGPVQNSNDSRNSASGTQASPPSSFHGPQGKGMTPSAMAWRNFRERRNWSKVEREQRRPVSGSIGGP